MATKYPAAPRLATLAACAALAALAACGHAGAAGSQPTEPVAPVPAAGAAVQAWVTTGDGAKTLSHEPDLHFAAAAATVLPLIDVDTTRTYQAMIGFGAAVTDASAYLIQEKMSATQREALLQDLFGRANGGLGLSFTRVPMGASDFSLRQYSYDDVGAGQTDPTLSRFSIDADRADKLPVLKRALAINPALRVMATPWSPPGWMKTSGSLIGGTLRPEAYDAFAEYFARFIEAYGKEGVPIYAVSVQNEPHFEPADYPGMRLEPPARARVIGDHVGPLFAARGIGTLIWDWDHNWDQPDSPNAVLADPAVARYVQGVAWHCYAGDVGAQSAVHEAHPDKDAYFTECSGGDWAKSYPDNLKYFVGTLVIGTTRNWARAVALWNLALDEQDGPHTGGCGNCRGVVTVNSTTGAVTRNVEYFALAHASRFVRPGAVRVESTSGVQGLTSVAFRNADDGSKALLVLNSGAAPQTFVVRHGTRSFQYTLPAASVATFSWS